MTRVTPYLAVVLLGLTGCTTDSVREASAVPPTLASASDTQPASSVRQAHELRRVWSGPRFSFYWNEPSPDGRYVSEIDWDRFGDLAVRDLVTGEMVPVTRQSRSDGFAYGSVFSPDGTRMAYRWFLYASDSYELRVIDIDGSDERVLIGARPDLTSVLPTDWSAAGQDLLAAVERPDRTVQLALIGVADGSIRVLTSLGWRWPAEALLSPDGRHVAYSLTPSSETDPTELRILAVDGSQEVVVAPHSGRQRMLGWTPDGRSILFYQYEPPAGSIWQAAISDGRSVGEPILIESDVRVSSIGFSNDAYFFGTQVESEQVHTATFDPSGGGFVAEPRPVADPGTSRTGSPAWSLDGEQLAFVRQEPSGPVLVVRGIERAEERSVPLTDLTAVYAAFWAPDGESVLLHAQAKARKNVGYALYRVDLTSGEATFLLGGGAKPITGTAYSPDGETLYFARRAAGVLQYDLSSGAERLLYADSATRDMKVAVSPDGRMIAFSRGEVGDPLGPEAREHRILVMPADGGEAREVFRTEGDEHIERSASIAWTVDGSSLLFVRGTPRRPHVLSRVSIDGGPASDVLELPCDTDLCTLWDVTIGPDGRRIALRLGRPKGEIWMMTGFGADGAAGAAGAAGEKAPGR